MLPSYHTFCRLFLFTALSLTLFPPQLKAQLGSDNEKLAIKALNLRDKYFENTSFKWSVTEDAYMKGTDQRTKDDLLKKSEERAKFRIVQNHVTDDKMKKQIQSEENKIVELMTTRAKYSSDWSITIDRNPDLIHLYGNRIEPSSKFKQNKHIYYGDKWVMFYDISQIAPGGLQLVPTPPYIHGSSGAGQYTTVGDGSFFYFFPYDLNCMAQTNPLKVFGGNWKYEGLKEGNPYFTKQIRIYSYSEKLSKLSAVLDKSHGYLPIRISEVSEYFDHVYTVKHLMKYRDQWMPDEFTVSTDGGSPTPDFRRWKLTGVSESPKLKIVMPDYMKKLNNIISDTRLVGPDLDPSQLLHINYDDANQYVHYKWDGHVPTLDELRKLSKTQKFNQFSENPFVKFGFLILGICFIAAGLFLKLRKPRKEKEAALPAPKK